MISLLGRRFSLVLLVFLCALSLNLNAHAQEPARLTIHKVDDSAFPIVQVFFTATDYSGLPISGLGHEDFSVYEESRPADAFVLEELANSDQTITVVLVIDTSQTMYGKPLEDTKAAAKSFIGSLVPGDKVGLVTFSDEAQIRVPLTDALSTVTDAIGELEAQGKSPLYDAIEQAVGMLKNLPPGRKAIILLSDGHDDGSTFTFQETIQEAELWAIPIYPIGFGHSVNKDTIEKIASRTAGYAQIRPDTSELQEAFDTVRQVLRHQYFIEFASELPADGTQHTLMVNLNYLGAEYTATHNFLASPREVLIEMVDLEDGQIVGGDVKLEARLTAPAMVASVEYLLDDDLLTTVFDKPFTYVWDSSAIAEGEHILTVIATDNVGNTGRQDYHLSVRPAINVTWESPIEGDSLAGPTTLQVGVDALAGVAKVEFFADGVLIGEIDGAPYEFDWSLQDVQPGAHSLRVVATDVNNKADEADININVSLRRNTLVFWLALVVVLVAAGVMIPIANRRRKRSMLEKPRAAIPSSASLLEIKGLQPDRVWPLALEEVRIGRKRDANDIHATGLSASRRHAIIRAIEGRFVLFNLNPANPTVINGQAVETQHALSPGDEIQVGESVFRFQSDDKDEDEQ
ncbi:MAG: VWA domain-containing protein [Anaerolineales bacterium]|nr:VWA domain-containing protein [Anaerolineales bacterium]